MKILLSLPLLVVMSVSMWPSLHGLLPHMALFRTSLCICHCRCHCFRRSFGIAKLVDDDVCDGSADRDQ